MNQKSILTKPFLLFCCFWQLASATAQATIAYFNGPPFPIPSEESGLASIDFDQDSNPDFSFARGYFICTADVPVSGCSASYSIYSLGSNATLCTGSDVVVMPAGAVISGQPSTNATWRTSQYGATIATYHFSPRYGTAGWSGPLVGPQEGYLGIRFHAPDGPHYGWVHVRMPSTNSNLQFSVTILDWAYETRPNVAITAGAVPMAPLSTPVIVRPGFLRLQLQTEIGKAYQVQFQDQLSDKGWQNIDVTLIATATNTALDLPLQNSHRFYRAVRTE